MRQIDRPIRRPPTEAPYSRRVRRARKNGTLSGCHHFAIVGQTIILLDGQWHCAPCVLAQITAATAKVGAAS
jgi:hypothetical protein